MLSISTVNRFGFSYKKQPQLCLLSRVWQPNAEHRTLGLTRSQRNSSLMQLNNPPADCQPQSRSAAVSGVVATHESIEDNRPQGCFYSIPLSAISKSDPPAQFPSKRILNVVPVGLYLIAFTIRLASALLKCFRSNK
jgi:hypothetical protein